MISFTELKNTRKDTFQKLTEKLNKMASSGFENQDDDTFWQPTVDKAKNGYAVIRFLPAPPGEEDDFVRIWRHAFQGPGGWYIQNSLTTPTKEHPQGQPDPVGEMNSKLWHSGKEEDKAFVSGDPKAKPPIPGSKRKVEFVANIYVVEDTGKPENKGKVFRYRFGKRIYDKIFAASNPTTPDVVKFNPFDMWEDGANFKIKIRNVEGYRNYDSSEWDLVEDKDQVKHPRGKLFDDDDKLEKIWKSEYSLQEVIGPSKFKSYNELKAHLARAMGWNSSEAVEENPKPTKAPKALKVKEPKPLPSKEETPPWSNEVESTSSEENEDDDMSFFKNLADAD